MKVKPQIIAAEFHGGQPIEGASLAPKAIVDALSLNQLNVKVVSLEKPASDPLVGRIKNSIWTGSFCKELSLQTFDAAKNGFVLTLGGDHSIAVGSISGLVDFHGELSVVWVDAHADINTPSGSLSGNIHGCPLSFLLGLEKNKLPGFDWLEKDYLKPSNIVYIGLRDLDEAEKTILQDLNIKTYSMKDVEHLGIAAVMKQTLEYLPGKVHLSFDIDALDPYYAFSTGTSVSGGLTIREGRYICESLFDSGRLVSMDLAEVNPLIGTEIERKKTLESACILLKAALGYSLV